MEVVGYTDKLSVRPGERLKVMVSCRSAGYRARIVRLRHGDIDPAGPGFRATPVSSIVEGEYPGRVQAIHPGSYVRIPEDRPLAALQGFTVTAWILPTWLPGRRQAIVSRFCEAAGTGFGLFLTSEGRLELRIGGERGMETVTGRVPLREGRWYFVAGSFDPDARVGRIEHRALRSWAGAGNHHRLGDRDQHEATVAGGLVAAPVSTLIAAAHGTPGESAADIVDFFNGKIDNPILFGTALSPAELDLLRRDGRWPPAQPPVAAWSFAEDVAGAHVRNRSGNGLSGVTVNAPARAVTGHGWSAREVDFGKAPGEYGAIHFHDDDLEDAGWSPDFELIVPADWPSGIYAVELSTGGFDDYLPFIVRPGRQAAKSAVAFLAPTLTYLAYANDHMPTEPGLLLSSLDLGLDEFLAAHATEYEAAVFRYMVEQRLHSQYDRHGDGSPVIYGTRLRPLLNIRPRYNKPNLRFRHPHLLSCDLYLVDWLAEKGIAFDTIDDESLHAEGLALLADYKVLLTGSHPEYWTREMLGALQSYLEGGGRLMYLGGNGFYWVTTIDPARPHLNEVRRGFAGLRTWSSAPGEGYHSTTGECGGLWRFRGIPPQSIVGVGFSGVCGLVRGRPYRRTPAAGDERARFIFAGVEEAEFGDYGLHLGGAAGWEIDRADPALGTPPNALVVASSYGHGDDWQVAIEEVGYLDPAAQGGASNALVRSDLTYFELPGGGAVFSVGSISWCGSLSFNGYDNAVSRITENVLRAFIGRER